MDTLKIFLIIPPGLEDLALQEISLKLPPLQNMTSIKGGIEGEADIEWIEAAHLILKIPTRILLRITEFKVRDFPKLYQKFLNFKWTKYLSHPEPEWQITCTKSRLNHTGRMEETIQKALKEALIKQPLNEDWKKRNFSPQTFYIRLHDDTLTLSLDLTGEPLYKRGLQKIKGEAPIRENFAASFAMEIFKDIKSPVTLIDPMCGSGTLLTEALTFHQALHLRPFAFETAPFYKGRNLKKNKPESHLKIIPEALPIKEAIGFDLNAELILKVESELRDEFPIKLHAMDSLSKKITSDAETIMLCNPPYGERIKIEGQRGSFLREAWTKFLSIDKPKRFGWVLPSDMDDLFKTPNGYNLLTKRPFKNGGMAVTFWIWERQL